MSIAKRPPPVTPDSDPASGGKQNTRSFRAVTRNPRTDMPGEASDPESSSG